MLSISPSARLRPSPFFDAVTAEGVVTTTTYNQMLLPTGFGDPEAEYWRLIEGVSLWDVAAERQVELRGPDAAALAQILTVRDLSKMVIGQGKYAPLCDHDGVLLNDPIVMKVDEDRYWFSIADSNIWFWARAVARERGLNVVISEPDVSPLAVQGPKAEDVVAAVFGDWVRELKYFWFRPSEVAGIPVMVARSGWSKQGGFEIYLLDGRKGSALWQIFREAGAPFGIGPGNPNWCERIESGLLSWGGDTDGETNPFEVRLGRYVSLDLPDEVIGIAALRRIAEEGPKRHQLGLILDEETPAGPEYRWCDIQADGRKVGDLTNCVWSRRLKVNIGFALVSRALSPGDSVMVTRPTGPVPGRLTELPFI